MANPIDTISQFAALIELMQNPQQFSALVKEAQKVRDETKKLVEAKTKIDAVDAYVAGVQEELTKTQREWEKNVAEHELTRDAFRKGSTAKSTELAIREDQIEKRERDLNMRSAKVDEYAASVDKKYSDAQAQDIANVKKTEELAAAEQRLQEKAKQIASVFN